MSKIINAILLALLLVGCAEYLPMSGGALDGKVSPLPLSLERIIQDKI